MGFSVRSKLIFLHFLSIHPNVNTLMLFTIPITEFIELPRIFSFREFQRAHTTILIRASKFLSISDESPVAITSKIDSIERSCGLVKPYHFMIFH